jgi:hypothetical protein
MNFYRARYSTAFLFFVIWSFGMSAPVAAQEERAGKNPIGTVTGKVTIQNKGARGVVVGLRRNDSASQREPTLKATTDESGDYRIGGIAPGRYVIAPLAPGFVVTDYPFSSQGKTILIVEGDTVEDINFALVPGGVITGKVVDADGRPVIEERITLLPSDPVNKGAKTAFPNGPRNAQTDDRGIYRIFGVAAGHYKVAVNLAPNGGQVTPIRRPYQQTFYPDTANVSKAGVVEVSEGGETSNIDIVIGRALQTFSVSGQIVDGETGRPVLNRRWGLARISDNSSPAFDPTHYPANSRGEFTLENLLPGKYSVFAQPELDAEIFSESVAFEIVDKNIEGLVIKTSTGGSLSGKIVVESGDKAIVAKLPQMRLNVYLESPATAFPNWFSAALNPDGSFHLGGLQPGTAHINMLSATDPGLVKDFLILKTERDGIEQPQGIELKASEQITGITVLIANGTGVVTGDVKYLNGPPPVGARVQVNVIRFGEIAPLSYSEVDARGRFRIERLPSGSYWLDGHAFLPFPSRQPPSVRQQFNITAGSVTETTITLDLSPGNR